MKIFNVRDIIIFTILVIFVGYIKTPYIPTLDLNNMKTVFYQLFIHWGDNQYVNIIWIFPVFASIYFIVKEVYIKLSTFDTRYKNRRRYIRRVYLSCFISTLLYSAIALIIQYSIATLYINNIPIMYNFIFKYITEVLAVSFFIILVSLIIKHFVYALLSILSMSVIFINFTNVSHLPFISLYANMNYNVWGLIIIIGVIVMINYYYQKVDLDGGYVYGIRN